MNENLNSNANNPSQNTLPPLKSTKKRFVKYFVILLFIALGFALYSKYQNNTLGKYFILPSFQKKLLNTAEDIALIKDETSEIKNVLNSYKNSVSDIDLKIQNLNLVIEDSLKKIEAKERANIVVVSSLFKLVNSLNSTKNFSDLLDNLLGLSLNNNLVNTLEQLKPYTSNTKKDLLELKKDYSNIYKYIYLDYLQNKPDFLSKIHYLFLNLVFIEFKQVVNFNENSIEYKLQEVKILLDKNPAKALEKIKNLIVEYNINNIYVNNWVEELTIKVKFLSIIDEINNYINIQYLAK